MKISFREAILKLQLPKFVKLLKAVKNKEDVGNAHACVIYSHERVSKNTEEKKWLN